MMEEEEAVALTDAHIHFVAIGIPLHGGGVEHAGQVEILLPGHSGQVGFGFVHGLRQAQHPEVVTDFHADFGQRHGHRGLLQLPHPRVQLLLVDLEVVTVVVLLAALDEILHEGDGAGSVQAVADLPGDIAGLRVANLGQELGQTGVQLLVFDFSRIQKGFYLRGSGGFAPESHQTQRGGHDDGGYEDSLKASFALLSARIVAWVLRTLSGEAVVAAVADEARRTRAARLVAHMVSSGRGLAMVTRIHKMKYYCSCLGRVPSPVWDVNGLVSR
ncbi:hypothetical protein EYF80_027309 [Liparis tanakae]|uniref:Uncharacterized protein n=1 Tax=Liparis tanakae TaxID=230148 RepID=A0A4Z2H9Q7_9TELE|nr:hypothetical protein EYF80_027309 [Liparis tanakae]